MIMKTAGVEDIDGVYSLSNDPEVRRVSLNPQEISYEDHVGWYTRTISDRDTVFLVFYDEETLIGQIRFSVNGKTATVSISFDNSARGTGLPVQAMESALEYIRNDRVGLTHVDALIKPDNERSVEFFRKFGFEQIDESTQADANIMCLRVHLEECG